MHSESLVDDYTFMIKIYSKTRLILDIDFNMRRVLISFIKS